jgi:hypothetical protein
MVSMNRLRPPWSSLGVPSASHSQISNPKANQLQSRLELLALLLRAFHARSTPDEDAFMVDDDGLQQEEEEPSNTNICWLPRHVRSPAIRQSDQL